MTEFPPIEQLLPHSGPMVLLDKVVDTKDGEIRCEVVIREACQFAGPSGVPAYVAIEYMAQTIGAFDGLKGFLQKRAPRIGFLVGTKRLDLQCDYFAVGQRLLTEAKMSWDGGQLLQFDCEVFDSASMNSLAKAVINVYAPTRDNLEI